MESSKTRETLLPERLRAVTVPLSFAVRITGRTMPTLWRAVREGRLKSVPYPAGESQIHWQVTLGDLVDYTGTPLSPEWLAVVEQCLAWKPGEEVKRVA
jgi:hypothetical protein